MFHLIIHLITDKIWLAISKYICPISFIGFCAVRGIPASVEDIIVLEIGILPSNGTPRRSLSFSPPPVLNKSKLILKFPSLSIDISSQLI